MSSRLLVDTVLKTCLATSTQDDKFRGCNPKSCALKKTTVETKEHGRRLVEQAEAELVRSNASPKALALLREALATGV